MVFIYRTKKQILKLFVNGTPLTLTDISKQLGLAPSTVSQHLNELKDLGAIQEVDRQGTKKWKYYKMNLEKVGELYAKWNVKQARTPVQNYNYGTTWQRFRPFDMNRSLMNARI